MGDWVVVGGEVTSPQASRPQVGEIRAEESLHPTHPLHTLPHAVAPCPEPDNITDDFTGSSWFLFPQSFRGPLFSLPLLLEPHLVNASCPLRSWERQHELSSLVALNQTLADPGSSERRRRWVC